MTELLTSMISELEQKAHAGDAQAQLEFAFKETNKEKAFMYLNKAAEQGFADAQLSLGLYYSQRVGELLNREHHPVVGMKLIHDHHICGTFYFLLNDKKADANGDNLAFTWFEKSAKQGLAPAQYLLAHCYRDGIGVKQNDELAFAWFKKAAEQDFAAAQCDVAYCYHIGKGVGQHDGLAFAWTNKAVEQTDACMLHRSIIQMPNGLSGVRDGFFHKRVDAVFDCGKFEPKA